MTYPELSEVRKTLASTGIAARRGPVCYVNCPGAAMPRAGSRPAGDDLRLHARWLNI